MANSVEAGLIELWRYVACRADLQELVAASATLLAGAGVEHRMRLYGLDGARLSVLTLAEQPVGRELAEQVWTARNFEAMAGWVQEGLAAGGPVEKASALIAGLVPPCRAGRFWAGPLLDRQEPLGVLMVTAENLPPSAVSLCGRFAEIFRVALCNGRQWRELTKLREAAEADRRKLLFRLDRQDISESIVGAETGLRGVMERVGQVSRSDVPVLLLGETGSGKEVVARAVHNLSVRASGPFIRVNCGAIPPELIDSQLFGHEKGSFTGAHDSHKGWFERADGGTLFLDEIGELPLPAQVRLLRILQDGTFERVGGQKQIKSDLRIVAATHRDLPQMVGRGEFREDLWYRIAVFLITIPPLRDRRQDIPALATHFALGAAKRLGSPPLVPTREDMGYLLGYSWPGNIRELAAVIERAAILGNGRSLDVRQALGSEFGGGTCPGGCDAAGENFETLDQAMARHIRAALRRTRGRIDGQEGAAGLLGINPSTLRARMRKLGISREG